MHRRSATTPRAGSGNDVLQAASLGGLALAASMLLANPTAGAADHAPDLRTRSATPDAYVYINYATGEKIISTRDPDPFRGGNAASRGSHWSWSSRVIDPCAPEDLDDSALTTAIFTRVHDEDLGDAQDPNAVGHWHDWFEHPGDSIIESIHFTTFVQIPDVDKNGDGVGDGIEGLDWFFIFTENDGRDGRQNAVAHSPILVENIVGSLDLGAADGAPNDGEISFQEGQLIFNLLDFSAGQIPTDIEVGDTNGESDGAFGFDSIYAGVPGVDTDGDGLINSGFVVGFRQPGVTEGDGIISRFPELAGLGLENPVGGPTPDPPTFTNIRPVGFSLGAPSDDLIAYQDRPAGQIDWPYNPAYGFRHGEGQGSVDGYARIDADGIDTGLHFADLFACDPDATSPPFYEQPWIAPAIEFNLNIEPPGGCNDADLDFPYYVLDLADIAAFIGGFQSGSHRADIAIPFGVLDLADISLFVTEFQAGCP